MENGGSGFFKAARHNNLSAKGASLPLGVARQWWWGCVTDSDTAERKFFLQGKSAGIRTLWLARRRFVPRTMPRYHKNHLCTKKLHSLTINWGKR